MELWTTVIPNMDITQQDEINRKKHVYVLNYIWVFIIWEGPLTVSIANLPIIEKLQQHS